MSVERCDKHDRFYDTDVVEMCPRCEADEADLDDAVRQSHIAASQD